MERMEEIIREFWLCSLNSDFSSFDWDEAFDEYEPMLAQNCIEHGLGTFEEFKDSLDNIYGLDSMSCDIPDWATYKCDWGWFDENDAMEALLLVKYNFMRKNFQNNVHGDNAELLERLRNRGGLSEPQLIELFDECIHAQHATGNIIEDLDVDEIRSEVEEEWTEEQKRFATNIRKFL